MSRRTLVNPNKTFIERSLSDKTFTASIGIRFIDNNLKEEVYDTVVKFDDVKDAVKELKEYILSIKPINIKSDRIITLRDFVKIKSIFGEKLIGEVSK